MSHENFLFIYLFITQFIYPALHKQSQIKEISLSTTLGGDLFICTNNTKLTKL